MLIWVGINDSGEANLSSLDRGFHSAGDSLPFNADCEALHTAYLEGAEVYRESCALFIRSFGNS